MIPHPFVVFRAVLLALLLASGALPAATSTAKPAAQPNVLFVLVDDLGWRDFGCYGSTLAVTPVIDQLAQHSVRFSDAYVAYPRCVPSRYAIFTGKHPARVQGNRDSPKITPGRDVTIGSVFASAGYDTFYNGKWHLGEDKSAPTANGFRASIAAGAAGATRSHFAPYTVSRGAGGEEKAAVPDLDDAPADEYLADRQTTEMIKYLRQRRDRPFFAVLAFYAVHTPIQGKEDYTKVYQAKLAKQPMPAKIWEKESAGENLLVQNNAAYGAMVQSVDENIGRLLRTLDELKIADDTIIVICSDHGGLSARGNKREVATSNRPLRAGKGHLYEGGLRIPLLVRWPGHVEGGRLESTPVSTLDLLPTLAELAGVRQLPGGLDGRSFAPLLRGGSLAPRPLFWHNPAPRPGQTADLYSSAIREGNLKLIEFPDDQRVELYDLASDLGEARDLSGERPADRARLLAQLNEWRQQVGASAPKQKSGAADKPAKADRPSRRKASETP